MRYSCCTIFALAIALGCEAVPAIAQMQPNAGTTVDPMGNRLDIRGTQVSGKNQFNSFQTFNVNSGQTANFIPNNANIQNILSRVTGGTPSQIQGMIQSANGVNLFLMNPSGILFGNGASLDIKGSFTATTANAIGFGNNLWFNAAGNNNTSALTGDPIQFAFTSANPGAIVNTGNLTLPANQSLNLIGGTVINTGTIATPGGNITIAAVEGGKAVQISTPGSILSYTLPVDAISAINPAIGNPVSLPELLSGATASNATGIEVKDGIIRLTRSQTQIPNQPAVAVVSNTIDVSGETGGKIGVFGQTVGVIGSTLEASGKSGGGSIQVGGSYQGLGSAPNAITTVVDRNSKLRVNAIDRGDAGEAVIWSDGTTRYAGSIEAKGGTQGGNGGSVEVSGRKQLGFTGSVDISAAQGRSGTLLLDPDEIQIVNGDVGEDDKEIKDKDDSQIFYTDGGSEKFTISEIALEKLSGNVTLEARNKITLQNLDDDELKFANADSVVIRTGTRWGPNFTTNRDPGRIVVSDGKDTIVTSKPDANLTFNSDFIEIGNLRTNGGKITINADIYLIRDTDFTSNGGDISLNRSVQSSYMTDDQKRSLTIDAGTGNIITMQSLGGAFTTPLRDLKITGDTLAMNGYETNATGDIIINVGSFSSTSRLAAGRDLFIRSADNVTLTGVVIDAGRSLIIESGKQLTIADTVGEESSINSGLNLRLQGNSGINLQLYRRSESGLTANGDITLISNGDIIADSTFQAGNNFSIQKLDDSAANLIQTNPNFNSSIISANGDVSFNGYEGFSLKVESLGSIRSDGDIIITDPNPSITGIGNDSFMLHRKPSLILRAGLTSLSNVAKTPRTVSGVNFTESGSRSPGQIIVKNITVGSNSNLDSSLTPSVILSATHGITTGDVSSGGAIEASTTTGNIKMGHVSSLHNYKVLIPTTITANLGNIEVESLKVRRNASIESKELILDIFAGGTFRAIGTIQNSYSQLGLRNTGTEVLDFLNRVTKTNITQSLFDSKSSPYSSVNYVVYTPVSISSSLGGAIRIRYAGGGGLINRPKPGLELQGGSARFEIGAKEKRGDGEPYVPTDSSLEDFNIDSTKSFGNFIEKPFSIAKNATYTKLIIPEGASGTVGAIVRNIESDGSLTIGVVDQAFGILPTNPDPKPDPKPNPKPDPKTETKIPTIDLETRNPSKLATCPETKTIAIAPTEATRSSEISPSKNPCLTDNNEDEILKILK